MRGGALVRCAVAVALVGGGAWAASKWGGASDLAHAMPRAPSGSVATTASTLPGEPGAHDPAFEIRQRFVDTLGEATRVDVPNLAAGSALLKAHWRKMSVPFLALPANVRPLATSLAIRTSATETPWVMPKSNGGMWSPDVRVWNMSEGSFDQRESIFLPAPATVAFKVTVPPDARLSFAAAVVNTVADDTVFDVAVTPAGGGAAQVACSKRVVPGDARAWFDVVCPLAAWAGQTVEIAFATRAVPHDKSLAPTVVRPAVAPPASTHHHATKAKDAKDAKEAAGDADPTGAGSAAASALPRQPPGDEAIGGTVPLALVGNPTLLARAPSRLPYNVLWIVVDALRPDVIASFHDDAEDDKKRHAPHEPLDALLPKIEGLTPTLDALAKKSVRFTHAYSNGAWTRPGTLAMLSGMRSTELGLDPTPWVLPDAEADRYYRSDPPVLPRLLRREGVVTRAFVNNYFMVGYAPVGVDMGFERVDDHRYRTRDTLEITENAVAWLRANKDERFFLFCNYNSPHEPWEPPPEMQKRVPPAPAGPGEWIPRQYMAEAAKDDEAIGVLLHALEESGLAKNTLVVVTADHGETLSAAHDGRSKMDNMPVRFHHAVSNYEETTRVPILLSLPGVLPEDRVVKERVRSIDIAPTVLAVEGLAPDARMSGRSMLGLARGEKEADERVVLTEGRGTRGLIVGKHRLLVREGAAQTTTWGDKSVTVAEELYDLEDDPGERHDLAPTHRELVAEMRARLEAAKKNVAAADAHGAVAAAPAPTPSSTPTSTSASTATATATATATPTSTAPTGAARGGVHLRFAGGGGAHRVSGSIAVPAGTTIAFEPVGVAREAFTVAAPNRLDLALSTAPGAAVGVDLRVDPPSSRIDWELFVDDAPLAADHVFAGRFGLLAPALLRGIATDEARTAAFGRRVPEIDPARDLGLFVTVDDAAASGGAASATADVAPERDRTAQGAREMDRLMKEWGYARASKPAPK